MTKKNGQNQRLNAAVKKFGNREVHSQVSQTSNNFLPLTYFREDDELICGTLPIKEKQKRIKHEINYPWDLISNLKEDIEADFKVLKPKISGKVHKSAVLLNKKAIHIGRGAEISPCAVLDASKGPIFIGDGTIVHPHALLRGPLYIGKNCRIAGEITNSIFMDNVNKAHYGFIGHSYICSWVNLGAGTTNSNLKNNYTSVKVFLGGKLVDSKQTFVGCFIGDHAKTAIGTMLYTGCVVGVCANLFGEAYYKKHIPSFSWGTKGTYKLEDAIATAKTAMARRSIKFTSKDELLFSKVFALTKNERV